MKIGILTFHWATNYGAVLQCYALQEYLRGQEHEVEIINYKPLQYEDSVYKFFRYRKFLHLGEYINTRIKEKALKQFRCSHLNMTDLVRTCSSVGDMSSRYDIIISGSDQVTNSFFLKNGEGTNITTPTYFLGFPFKGKRIGYALSFGCTLYPEDAKRLAMPFVADFDAISVRERTGVDIVKSMGRKDAVVVPDPTILMESLFYHTLADNSETLSVEPYYYIFFIRNISDRKPKINKLFSNKNIIWNNEDGDYTMYGWLAKIQNAQLVITDSFHCVVMCLKLHKQFLVVTEKEGNIGMNDRLFTLLSPLGLDDRIIHKNSLEKKLECTVKDVDWTIVDNKLSDYSQIGKDFLKTI